MSGKEKEEFVYRISPVEEWQELEKTGSTLGREIDRSTACIHLSNLNQNQDWFVGEAEMNYMSCFVCIGGTIGQTATIGSFWLKHNMENQFLSNFYQYGGGRRPHVTTWISIQCRANSLDFVDVLARFLFVQSTLQRFFLNSGSELYLLQIDSKKLGEGLIYEAADDSTFFPHFYGPSRSFVPLPLDAVIKAEKITLTDGQFSCALLS